MWKIAPALPSSAIATSTSIPCQNSGSVEVRADGSPHGSLQLEDVRGL